MYRATWRTWRVRESAVATTIGLTAACATGGPPSDGGSTAGTATAQPPAWIAKMDSAGTRVSSADVEFMQGMIHHHAQAILMASWAPSNDASPAIRELAQRIIVAQRDEIAFMQRWLAEKKQEVPDADTSHFMMRGMDMKLMPGMLTIEQLELLKASRAKDFDRRFLELMIQHHEGAITMVQRLFQSQGAAQDEYVFRFASEVDADQSAEVDRMRRMLTSGSLSVPRDKQ